MDTTEYLTIATMSDVFLFSTLSVHSITFSLEWQFVALLFPPQLVIKMHVHPLDSAYRGAESIRCIRAASRLLYRPFVDQCHYIVHA